VQLSARIPERFQAVVVTPMRPDPVNQMIALSDNNVIVPVLVLNAA
jgi:hypothetical protein